MSRRNRAKPTDTIAGAGEKGLTHSRNDSKTPEVSEELSHDKHEQLKKSETTKDKKPVSFLAGFTSGVAVVSILASLFGYGVVTGIAHSVGHDQQTVITSGFDLITMIWPGVLMIITSLSKVLSFEILMELWPQTRIAVVTVSAVMFVGAFFTLWLRPRLANSFDFREAARAFVRKDRALLGSSLLALLVALLSGLVAFLIQVMGVVLVIALFVLAVYVPSFGYLSGTAYVKKFVVEPAQCATSSGRVYRMAQSSKDQARHEDEGNAECILISSLDPKKPFFRVGRNILASSSAMLLWNPESGRAHGVPLTGMDVTSISESEFQKMHQLLMHHPASCLVLSADGGRLSPSKACKESLNAASED